MKKTTLYVGIDVDNNNFNFAIYDLNTKTTNFFKTRPIFHKLFKILNDYKSQGYELRACYEATYIGYGLCRYLRDRNIHCDIIAPALIPSMPGKKIKTDRLDAINLAIFYAQDLLTPIYIPDEFDEHVRSLIRTQKFFSKMIRNLKRNILSLCNYYSLNFKQETGAKSYWTKEHINWLKSKINKLDPILQLSFSYLMKFYDIIDEQITDLKEHIYIISDHKRYKKKKDILICFKGIGILTAMTLICEIGDVNRFKNPAKLFGYAGFSVKEYSSGGKERKYGITKMGSKHIRTTCPFGKSA